MKLKLSLISFILDNPTINNKYSRSFLNLKNVFELESKENFNFSKEFNILFKNIESKYNSFISEIPLRVIERYYIENMSNLNEFVFIEYNGNELEDVKVIDLYVKLEAFFEEMFYLACEIANFYNLEVKINKPSGENNYI